MLTPSRQKLAVMAVQVLLPAAGVADDYTSIAGAAVYDPPDCVDGAEKFTDVESVDSRCQYVEQLANDGIAVGCTAGPGGRFCPDDPVTRGQLAMYFVRAMRGTDSWEGGAPITRAISVPLTAFVDCESPGGYLPWTNEPTGSRPQFLHLPSPKGVVIEFDATPGEEDDNHGICTQLMLPPDYVSGTVPTVAAHVAVITPIDPPEALAVGMHHADGISNCNASLSGFADVELVTCTIGTLTPLAPGTSFSLFLRILGGGGEPNNDGVQIHSIELRYQSTK